MVKLGLDPTKFEWSESRSKCTNDLVVSKLTHKQTEYFFLFDILRERHYAIRSPGKDIGQDEIYTKDWQNQLIGVRQWLSILKKEIESPDLWSVAVDQVKAMEMDLRNRRDAEYFTSEEVAFINVQFDEIKLYVSSSGLDQERLQYISEQIDYLRESCSRQTRKDWLFLFIGIFTSFALSMGGGEKAIGIFKFALNAIASLFSGQPLLP